MQAAKTHIAYRSRLVAVVGLSLALANCGGSLGALIPTGSNVADQTTAAIAQFKSIVGDVCQVVPTIGTVAALLSAAPAVSTVSQIANAFCATIQQHAAARGAGLPTLYGVELHYTLLPDKKGIRHGARR